MTQPRCRGPLRQGQERRALLARVAVQWEDVRGVVLRALPVQLPAELHAAEHIEDAGRQVVVVGEQRVEVDEQLGAVAERLAVKAALPVPRLA